MYPKTHSLYTYLEKLLEEKFLSYIDRINDEEIKAIVSEVVTNKYNKILAK